MTPATYRWAVVGMLWFVCLFNYADRQAIYSVFIPIQEEMGLTDTQLGVVGSAFAWVYAVVMLFAGLVGDRVSRKGLILGGLVFWSVVTLATALAQNYWQLVLFRALEGLGEAFYFPASMSLISDYHRRETRSRAMALHQSSVYVGTVLGGTVAGYCGQFYGWRSGFYLFGGAGILLAAFLLFTLREPPREASDDRPGGPPAGTGDLLRGVWEVLTTPMVLVLAAVFVCTVFVGSIFLAWMPTHLKRQYDLSLSQSGLNATVWLQVGSVLGVVAGGWLADWWVRRAGGGRMWVQALGLFAGAPLLYFAGGAATVAGFLVLLGLFGFCKGVYDSNTWAALYDVVRPERRATALGLVNGLGWLLGGGIGPIVYAKVSGRYGAGSAISLLAPVYAVAGLLLVAGVLTLLPRRPVAPPPHEPDEEPAR